MADATIHTPGFTCGRRRKAGKEKEGEAIQVVRVSTEESRLAARFALIVRAESTQRVASILAKRYPGGDCRVKFPGDPGRFFVKDAAAGAGTVGLGRPDVTADR